MIIYNVTVKIDLSVVRDWETWMKTVHIPAVMATGYFESNKMLRLMLLDESDGITYAIQYACKSMAEYNNYQATAAPKLQAEHQSKFAEKFIAFRTLMRVVD